MKCTTIVAWVLLSFLSLKVWAQEGGVRGRITLSDSTTGIQGIMVYLEKTGLNAVSNGRGDYSIQTKSAGTYTLVAHAPGFQTLRKEVVINPNAFSRLDIQLTESVSKLPAVMVMTRGLSGLKTIPGAVNYIGPKELQRFSHTDINRILRTVPGVNIQEEDGFGLRPNIGLRGSGVQRSSRITIMEDGILAAPAPYAEPAAYYFPTAGRMHAIEVMKGSSQVKYGPFTTGGVINLVSTPLPSALSGKLSLSGGTFGTRNLHAIAGNAHSYGAYQVETFQYASNGFKQLDGGGPTGFEKKDYVVKFRLNNHPDAAINQSLSGKFGEVSESGNETYLGLTGSDYARNPLRRYAASALDNITTKQHQYVLTHQLNWKKKFTLTTSAYRTDFKRNWYKVDKVKDSLGMTTGISDILSDPGKWGDAYAIITGQNSKFQEAVYLKANNRAYSAEGLQTAFSTQYAIGKTRHQPEAGIRYHHDRVDRFQWEDAYAMIDGTLRLSKAGVHGTESNRIVDARALATYIQYRIRYKKLTLTAGLRNEVIGMEQQDFGKNDPQRMGTALKAEKNRVSAWIPGVGADYQFNPYLQVFGGVHKGFAPPGPQDQTQPEESINYELGGRFNKRSWSVHCVAFVSDYSNLLGSDLAASGGSGSGELFNAGKVLTKGLEASVACDLLSRTTRKRSSMPFSLNYTLTEATFQQSFKSTNEDWGAVQSGDRLPYLARNQFSASLGYEGTGFGAYINARYTDAMRTLPGRGKIPANQGTDEALIFDVSMRVACHRQVELFGGVNNAGNTKYIVARRPAGLRPGMPRNANIGLRITW